MAFFIGIAGPWILLMVLGLLATNRTLELTPTAHEQGWAERLSDLLRPRDVAPRPVRVLRPTTIADAAPIREAAASENDGVPAETVPTAIALDAADPEPVAPLPAQRRRRARISEAHNGHAT